MEKKIPSVTYQASISILISVWSTFTSLQSASIPSGLTNQTKKYKELQQESQKLDQDGGTKPTPNIKKKKLLDLHMYPCAIFRK